MKRYRFYLIIAFMLLISFFSLKVNGQGKNSIVADRMFYEELEEEYTKQLSDVLAKKGYRNAGITMTKVYYEDGRREYTVQIHHKRIDRLSDGEKQLLMNELSAVCFGDSQCSVVHRFLSYKG